MLRTAVVVGGGIGGIPVAIAMCKAGFQVKVHAKFCALRYMKCVGWGTQSREPDPLKVEGHFPQFLRVWFPRLAAWGSVHVYHSPCKSINFCI